MLHMLASLSLSLSPQEKTIAVLEGMKRASVQSVFINYGHDAKQLHLQAAR